MYTITYDLISFRPTAQAKMNDQFAIQSYNCKELNGQSQEAIFYKRLITIILSNLAIQVSLRYKIIPENFCNKTSYLFRTSKLQLYINLYSKYNTVLHYVYRELMTK